jgi:1,4-alpha-glucan branching enzyme
MNAKTKSKANGKARRSPCVCLQLACPGAHQVFIVGSFNDWQTGATPMIRLRDGKWSAQLNLAPGHHEYRFIVDGQWTDDPAATEWIPNPFGGANAVLEVS